MGTGYEGDTLLSRDESFSWKQDVCKGASWVRLQDPPIPTKGTPIAI